MQPITVRRPPRPGAPPQVNLGDEPPNSERVEEAWAALQVFYPYVHRGYLTGLLTGGLVAQRGNAYPPMVVVQGDTGTSKRGHVVLATAMLGSHLNEVELAERDVTQRQLGLAFDRGPGFIYFDEIGRTVDPFRGLGAVLKAGGRYYTYEAKYANTKEAPIASMIVLTGSSIPPAVAGSPELERRVAAWRLIDRIPDEQCWERDGLIEDARKRDATRAVLDTITASIWWLLYQAGPHLNWRAYCYEKLGAVRLRELSQGGAEEVAAREAAIRELYATWQGAAQGQILEGGHWQNRPDHLNCSPGQPLRRLVEELIDFGADPKVRHGQIHDLQQTPLDKIIPEVVQVVGRLRIVVHTHGQNLGVKFLPIKQMRGTTPRQGFPRLAEQEKQ